jgi:predicted nucleotidyltransferase
MSQSAQEILRKIAANREILRRYVVRRLGLFGSHARGTGNEASDLDFVVEFERKSFDAYMGLKEFLEAAFGRRVDLVLADGIKPRLRESILKEAIYAEEF